MYFYIVRRYYGHVIGAEIRLLFARLYYTIQKVFTGLSVQYKFGAILDCSLER